MAKAFAVDSPVGAGGTTLVSNIKSRLGIEGIPTSLFYRGYSEGLLRSGVDPLVEEEVNVARWLEENNARFRMVGEVMLLDSEDITHVCHTEPNDKGASRLAGLGSARAIVNEETCKAVAEHPADIVATEGRNEALLHIGADTFALGCYLTAAPETRAMRRASQRGLSDVSAVLSELAFRDYKDMTRSVEPLGPKYSIVDLVKSIDDVPVRPAGRQLLVPTDHLDEEGVFEIAERAIARYRTQITS